MSVSPENSRPVWRWILPLWAAWQTPACDDTSSSGRLELHMGADTAPLKIQTGCAEECERPVVAVEIRYPKETYPELDTIELLQYRVEFSLDSGLGDVPYYAGPLALMIAPDDSQELKLTAAGDAQRELVEQTFGQKAVSGEAKVTLAGYDWEDRQVFVSSTFDVRFVPAQSDDPDRSSESEP
jgi:hypothetical protein